MGYKRLYQKWIWEIPVRSLEVADRTAHPFSQRDAELLSRLANQAALAIENATLYTQIERMAILEERDRIAKEIHDTLGQTLAYLGLKIVDLKQLGALGQGEQMREELEEIENAVRGATADVRDAILSLKMGISPNAGLIPTLTEYVERFGELTGLNTQTTVSGGTPVKLPPHGGGPGPPYNSRGLYQYP